MALVDEVLAANEEYAGGFTKGDLPMPPGRKFAVVACMDARLDPAKALGLEEGDAHVIRNAGGRAADAGTLLSFVGGDAEVVERLTPVLACYSSDIVHTGGVGTAQVAAG